MVKKLKQNKIEIYECEECNFKYDSEEWAKKCEEWCKKNHSCNLNITKHSIK